jgi:imidazolonepropionase-like amidohydrolase
VDGGPAVSGQVVLPLVLDAHVHLGLVDPSDLPGHGVGRVLDLGWNREIRELAAGAPVETAYAGQFLTAPGGYPGDRDWAPPGAVAAVHSPVHADEAVAEQVALGATVVKVVLNCDAGPVLDLPVLAAVVAAAHRSRREVVAHVEGQGMVGLALAGGVDVLAHTPWTERVGDDEVSRCAAHQRWVSTLDIHGHGQTTPARETAIDNLRRFHASGGRVVYGTDLGNGPLPVGINAREVDALLRAGLTPDEVIAAMTGDWPAPPPTDRVTVVPGPRDDARLGHWLAQARVAPAPA